MEKNRVEKYIEFQNKGRINKTFRWWVVNTRTQVIVGQVKWYGGWRKYVFYPEPNTWYDWDCMVLIAGFCERETTNHMLAKKWREKINPNGKAGTQY